MTTFESAISRSEAELAHVQSALDAVQHVLETADRAHSTGRQFVKLVFKMIRVGVLVLAIGGIAIAAFMLFDRLSHRSGPPDGDDTTDVTPIDQIRTAD
jgi:hypothetical protein